MSAERLHKVLASAGVASRRDCEVMISAGRVKVNGQVVSEPGSRVDPSHDEVLVDDQPIHLPVERVYIMLNKPAGVISTLEDPQGRKTVVELVNISMRIFPVGRLDAASEGLLLLTNDGELTHCLTHPSFEVEKEYHALLDRVPDANALRQWRRGVVLNGQATAPAQVEVIERTPEGVWTRIVLREGRKRQIREVADMLGYTVKRLIRIREGDLHLGNLPGGQWRHLSTDEIESIRAHANKPLPALPQPPTAERPEKGRSGEPRTEASGTARRQAPSRQRPTDTRTQSAGARSASTRRGDRSPDQANRRDQSPASTRYRDQAGGYNDRYSERYGKRRRDRYGNEIRNYHKPNERDAKEDKESADEYQQRSIPEEGNQQPPPEPPKRKPAPSRAWHEREEEKARQRKLGYTSHRDRNKR